MNKTEQMVVDQMIIHGKSKDDVQEFIDSCNEFEEEEKEEEKDDN